MPSLCEFGANRGTEAAGQTKTESCPAEKQARAQRLELLTQWGELSSRKAGSYVRAATSVTESLNVGSKPKYPLPGIGEPLFNLLKEEWAVDSAKRSIASVNWMNSNHVSWLSCAERELNHCAIGLTSLRRKHNDWRAGGRFIDAIEELDLAPSTVIKLNVAPLAARSSGGLLMHCRLAKKRRRFCWYCSWSLMNH